MGKGKPNRTNSRFVLFFRKYVRQLTIFYGTIWYDETPGPLPHRGDNVSRIIWNIKHEDDNKYNKRRQAIRFNESEIWLAYGPVLSYKQLRLNLRDLARSYPIYEITIELLEEQHNVEHYFRYERGSGKARMTLTTLDELQKRRPEYITLKPIHKRMIFGDTEKYTINKPVEIPRRQESAANRSRILAEAKLMKPAEIDITPEQWDAIQSVIPIPKTGRRSSMNDKVINALRWMIFTGGLWEDIPKRYGPWKSVYNRFIAWKKDGTLFAIFDIMQVDPGPLLVKRYY